MSTIETPAGRHCVVIADSSEDNADIKAQDKKTDDQESWKSQKRSGAQKLMALRDLNLIL